MRSKLQRALALAAVSLLGPGCGLEGAFNLYGGPPHTQPVSTVKGTISLPDPTFVGVDSAGKTITPFASKVADGQYEVNFIAGAYAGMRLRAIQGEVMYEAFMPRLPNEGTVEGVSLDARSTATVKLVEGLLGPTGKTLGKLSDDLLCITGKKLAPRYAVPGPSAELVRIMERIIARANLDVTTSTQVFQSPVVSEDEATGQYVVETSALNPDWVVRANYDYDGNGVLNQTTEAFDVLFLEALQGTELSAPPDPDLVRTVFTVNFNAGKLNGACGQIDRFRWVRNEPGRQMFFVGGIHKTSPVQDILVDAMLGNRGGWTPNQVSMYDDGTNGDQVAGDNIWSVAFDLPRGVRIGYKYTWGNKGDLWTGTEEWPGNQRIFEVQDVNGDGYVARFDNFGDEATNKDLYNLNPKSGGTLEWDEDLNGDGQPEAREVPADVDNDCVPDGFVTPDWVAPLTVSCEEFVAE
ncbi:MAG: hypothetical protein L0Y64_20175 [Myxococcaceae bacterium]|nr:hypothetical protein [Myxococcaceae bacterium]